MAATDRCNWRKRGAYETSRRGYRTGVAVDQAERPPKVPRIAGRWGDRGHAPVEEGIAGGRRGRGWAVDVQATGLLAAAGHGQARGERRRHSRVRPRLVGRRYAR